MVRVRLIIEGGGEGRRQIGTFRAAWRNFFQSAGLTINQLNIVRGGSRNRTFDRFLSALRNAEADELPILLVDSEGQWRLGTPRGNTCKPATGGRVRPVLAMTELF